MSVKNSRMPSRADHRRHDRLLVTRFATDDSYPGERDEAANLVSNCDDCASLAADVRQIALSMRSLPAPRRPRDFSLTPGQAQELQGSRLSRWLRQLSGPGWGVLRPVAGVAMSIGLVLAVIGTNLPVPYTAPAAAPVERDATATPQTQRAPAPQARPSTDPAAAAASRAPAATANMEGNPVALPDDRSGDPAQAGEGPDATDVDSRSLYAEATQDATTKTLDSAYVEASPDDGGPAAGAGEEGPIQRIQSAASVDTARDLLIYAGIAIAALSLGLLTLAWLARRYFADPLLR